MKTAGCQGGMEDVDSTRKKIKERSAFPRFTERYRFEYRIPSDYAIDDLSEEISEMRASGELKVMNPNAIEEAIESFRVAAMPATSK